MAAPSGLTRRKGAGGATFAGDSSTASIETDNGRITPSSSRRQENFPTGPETSYEASVDGHKIAYDPRDMAEEAQRNKQPKFSLVEEIVLLGLKDKQGILSFWNDNISYVLRVAIVMELALRGRISMQKDSSRRRFPLRDRLIEVIDDSFTQEVLLDEALKMMKASEKMSVGTWIDLMSGETWNLMKIGYQLKQVRERIQKGLVDKGVLTTEKQNFLLFDMATHPLVDRQPKDEIMNRMRNLLTQKTVILPASKTFPEEVELRWLRSICLACCAQAATVLENALTTLNTDTRERALSTCEDMLNNFSQWPFVLTPTGSDVPVGLNMRKAVTDEMENAKDRELQLEILPACISVLTQLESIL